MKRMVAVALVIGAVCSSAVFAADEAQAGKPACKKVVSNMCYAFGRGVVNCLTFWVEVPRNLWYENLRNPLFGSFTGLSDGGWLSVCRAFGGTWDVLSLGATGPGIYNNDIPDYVWQSTWVPADTQIRKMELSKLEVEKPAPEAQ